MSDERTSGPSPATELDDRALRSKAVRRSWACAGAGFALLGRDLLAISTYLSLVGAVGATAWLVLQPSAAALWATLSGLGIALALWVAEQVAVKTLSPRRPKPSFLVGGFHFVTATGWLAAIIVLVLLFTRFDSLLLVGSGMSPTLEKGERVLYETWVDPGRLRRGAVIVYRVSDRSAWGEPGWLAISRILAVPGDRLSARSGRYLANGEAGPALAATGRHAPVIPIPLDPETLTVPAGSYFVVQDSPTGGFDSRVLSWVQTHDVVGTRLYSLSGRRLLKPVE